LYGGSSIAKMIADSEENNQKDDEQDPAAKSVVDHHLETVPTVESIEPIVAYFKRRKRWLTPISKVKYQ
jgi:hypothetical protein